MNATNEKRAKAVKPVLKQVVKPKKKVSAAKKAANARWNKKAYDRFYLSVKKGFKAELFAHADEMGESLNHFINRAIQTQLAIDAENPEMIKAQIQEEKRIADEAKYGKSVDNPDETNEE